MKIAATTIKAVKGNIVTMQFDAIVNAANRRMLGGGGVDGAIHRAAGPQLKAACLAVPEVSPGVRYPTGEARLTPAFGRLRVAHIIHTVGPVYRDPTRSATLLASAYRSSLALAEGHGLRTIAFPAISCGVYAYPLDEAAEVALTTCRDVAGGFESVTFVLFDPAALDAWTQAADRLFGEEPLETR